MVGLPDKGERSSAERDPASEAPAFKRVIGIRPHRRKLAPATPSRVAGRLWETQEDLNIRCVFWHILQTLVGSFIIIISALVIRVAGFE